MSALEHPVIRRLLATGTTERLERAGCCCSDCGRGLYHGDTCYALAGEIFCKSCMKSYEQEVEA